jgi:hypothetical protein
MFLNDIFESEDDLFADNRRQSYGATLAALTEILNELVDEYSADPTEFADGGRCLDDVIAMRDAFVANDLVRGLSFVDNIDLSTLEDIDIKLNEVGINFDELLQRYDLNESDDMFAQRSKADVSKISTDQLRNMYSLAMSDSRQEYASAHKLQMARISTELKRRGVSVPVRENDDMFAGSNRAADQIKQDRHPLKDYISYETFEALMDEFDDLKSHTQEPHEQDAYLHKLRMADGLPREFFDVIEYYMYAPTKVKAANDTKLHNDLNNAFSRTWTEFKPSTLANYLARHMSQACLAAIRASEDELDEADDMFADRRGARIGNAIVNAGGVLINDAPHQWGDDQEMVDVTIQDGEDMIKVGKTFISQGVEAGIDAMFELDTMVRDQIWDAANSVGVDLNDHINESEEDMFAPASKSTIATAAKRNVVGKVAAKGRASRKTDTELQEIVAIAEQVFGRKYSSGTIGGGKVYRISLMTRGLGGMYHYNSMASVSKNDKIILGEQKKKFFNILTSRGLDTSRVDVKYHMGAMLYTSVRIKMQLPDAVVEDKYSMLINEMFENADDEMFAPQKGGKYWGNVPPEFNRLWGDLVPDSGAASTLEGELLRAANRLYYDYFNNGFGNNTSGAENFLRNFGGGSTRLMKALNTVHPYTRGIMPERSEEPQIELALDAIFDTILYQVLGQQGNYHPSPGDMFDYSERDDPNPEEEEDEWGYDEEDDDEEEY